MSITWTLFPVIANTPVTIAPFQEILDNLNRFYYASSGVESPQWMYAFKKGDSDYNYYYESTYRPTKSTYFLGLDTYVEEQYGAYKHVYPGFHYLRNILEGYLTWYYFYNESLDTFQQKTLAEVLTIVKGTTDWIRGPSILSVAAINEMQLVADYVLNNAWIEYGRPAAGLFYHSYSCRYGVSGGGPYFDSWSTARAGISAQIQSMWVSEDVVEDNDEVYSNTRMGNGRCGISSDANKERYWWNPDTYLYEERSNWSGAGDRTKHWSCDLTTWSNTLREPINHQNADYRLWWKPNTGIHEGQTPTSILLNGSVIGSLSGYVMRECTTHINHSSFAADDNVITVDENAMAVYTPPIELADFPGWNSTTNYIPGDCVVYNSGYYKCKSACINIPPPDDTYWEIAYDNGWSDCQFIEGAGWPWESWCGCGVYWWGTPMLNSFMIKPYFV